VNFSVYSNNRDSVPDLTGVRQKIRRNTAAVADHGTSMQTQQRLPTTAQACKHLVQDIANTKNKFGQPNNLSATLSRQSEKFQP